MSQKPKRSPTCPSHLPGYIYDLTVRLTLVWIILAGIALAPMDVAAQGNKALQAEFKAALHELPNDKELQELPPETRAQVVSSRSIYTEGAQMERMSNAEVLQLSLRLKANTAKAQQLISMLNHAGCIQKCLQQRTVCKDNCPGSKGLVCKCCMRCNLQLDICATRCLIHTPAAGKPRAPSPGKGARSR